MEKRAVVAIVLSLMVWLVWSYLFIKPETPLQTPPTVKKEEAVQPQKKAETPFVSIAAVQRVETVEKEIRIAHKNHVITLTNRGGSIKSYLYKYNGREIELVVPQNKFNARGVFDFGLYMNDSEFMTSGELDDALWSVTQPSENEVTFYATVLVHGERLRVEKKYSFVSEGNYFTLTFNLVNGGNKEIRMPAGHAIIAPADFLGPSVDFENTYNQLNSIYYIDNDFNKESKGGGFFSKPTDVKQVNGETGWVGIMSRYFLIIMVPDKFSGAGVVADNRKETGFRTGMYVPFEPIKPGASQSRSFKVYIGEKNKDKLASVSENLIDAADVSKWIEPIRDLLIWSLMKINILFGNFGWSLVIFSLLTKLVFLPLTQKSTQSMKKLHELTPQINELREKYKEKPEILNKKIMEIYKKNKVNPASGCLPILVQMPFFFALYSALINSIDLWQAPFVLWMKDLSLPDTIFHIAGFNVNVLPVLMTLTTYLQQKMSTVETTGQQKVMLMLMPFIFIVIFWNMPSGLVLYWIMQNVLQILHQLYINKRDEKKESAA